MLAIVEGKGEDSIMSAQASKPLSNGKKSITYSQNSEINAKNSSQSGTSGKKGTMKSVKGYVFFAIAIAIALIQFLSIISFTITYGLDSTCISMAVYCCAHACVLVCLPPFPSLADRASGVHSFSVEEAAAFTSHINQTFSSTLASQWPNCKSYLPMTVPNPEGSGGAGDGDGEIELFS